MKFTDITQLTKAANYHVNVTWDYLEDCLQHYDDKSCPFDLDPEFQRGHIWDEDQQIKYVEFKLKGGAGSNDIRFNCVGWMNSFEGPFVLVDGKQRIEAVRKFLNDGLKVFGGMKFSDFEGYMPSHLDFIFHINDLKTMEAVYIWYIELNTGGTPHTEEEINKVKRMIK